MVPTLMRLIRGTDKPGPYCCNRLFEWSMALAMAGIGIGLFLWPNAIMFGNLHQILRVISEVTLSFAVLYVGIVRICFLVANGTAPWIGPIIRAACAVCGSLIFSQMAAALAFNGQTPMPPGVFVFSALALGELVSAYRAAGDARERGR